ncbi:hypothetical protein [Streptomyces collinus]
MGHGTRPTASAGAAELNLAELMQGFFAGSAASDADALDYQDLPQDWL